MTVTHVLAVPVATSPSEIARYEYRCAPRVSGSASAAAAGSTAFLAVPTTLLAMLG